MPPDGILMGPIETSRWAHGEIDRNGAHADWEEPGLPMLQMRGSTAASRQSHALPNGDLGSVRSRKTIYSVDAIPLSAVKRATITCRDCATIEAEQVVSLFGYKPVAAYFGRNGPC